MVSIQFSGTCAAIAQLMTMDGVYVENAPGVIIPRTDQVVVQARIDLALLPTLKNMGGVDVLETEADHALKYANPTPVLLGSTFDLSPV